MNSSHPEQSIFHTDQGRWDRRDFERDRFSQFYNDNETRHSLWGHPSSEFYEGPAPDYQYDEYVRGVRQLPRDEEIEKVIQELLHNSQRIEAQNILVSVDLGDVTIRGHVKTEEEKAAAASLCELVHGVGSVHNELAVLPEN